jgi:predicted anti-sigma-YlaC factor YlaD
MSARSEQMSCQEFVELVTDYLEGRMPQEQLVASAAHLEECGGCSNYVEQMRHTVRALKDLVPGEISPQTREQILSAFATR